MQHPRFKIEQGLGETFVTFTDTQLLDEDCIREIREGLFELVDSGENKKILLNFAEVEFLSSSFLGALVKIHKRLCEKDGEITLINIDPKILKVFQITQLDTVFNIV